MSVPKTRRRKGKFIASIVKRRSKLHIRYNDPDTGKRIEKSTGLDDTPGNRKLIKNEVLPRLEAKLALGQLEDKKIEVKPFDHYSDTYLKFQNGIKTYSDIRAKINNTILPEFKGKKINEIGKSDVRLFASKLLKTREVKTVRNILTVLRGVFEMADDVVLDNPAKNVKLPKVDKGESDRVEPFKIEDVQVILDSIDDEWFRNFVAIGFYTGMRTGEIIGLMHKDIDYENKVIKVRRAIANGKVSTTKTASGIRDVPMFDNIVSYIKSQMKISNSLYLFTSSRGDTWYSADKISKVRWKNALKKAGIEYRQPYNMRHTFITSMLKSGKFSLLEIARIVGHSNIEMIIKNYARFIEGEQLKIDRSFDPFGGQKGEQKGEHTL